jgi:hypothetical protein
MVITPEDDELVMPALKKDEKVCFFWQENEFRRIRFVGEDTSMIYELVETAGRPMLKVSATPFHKWDFIKRIEADMPKGVVLDAGTGLGYTAIAAAKSARKVTTVELDRHVLQVQQLNPWSRELRKENIEQVQDDVVEYVRECKDATFDCVILQPGALQQHQARAQARRETVPLHPGPRRATRQGFPRRGDHPHQESRLQDRAAIQGRELYYRDVKNQSRAYACTRLLPWSRIRRKGDWCNPSDVNVDAPASIQTPQQPTRE